VIRFQACPCGVQYLVGTDRSLWMRLFPTRQHYLCVKCRTRQFLPRSDRVSWWIPREAAAAAVRRKDGRAGQETPPESHRG